MSSRIYERGDVDVVLTGLDLHEPKAYRERVGRLSRRTGGRPLSTALRTHIYLTLLFNSTALPTWENTHGVRLEKV